MLKGGRSQSCGCFWKERMIARFTSHGMSYSHARIYRVWSMMKDRCHNPRNTKFRDYGAKGVTVCDRWRESFEAFFADMGDRPSQTHSLDRIDPCGNYEPSNCRWATTLEQRHNWRPDSRNVSRKQREAMILT